jgi:hypothetical protein
MIAYGQRIKQNILRQHMHKKNLDFDIKCGNKLKHENEAEGPWPHVFHVTISEQNLFL